MKIKPTDSKALDFILDKILETEYQLFADCIADTEFVLDLNKNEVEYEFKRLLYIVKYFDCAKTNIDNQWPYVERNHYTKIFKQNGGFEKAIQDELAKIEKENEREQIELNLAKSNLEANELNKSIAAKNDKNETRNTVGMWVNIVIGVLNLVLLALQLLKD